MRESRGMGEGTKDKSKPLLRRRRGEDQKLESREEEEEEEDVFAQREMKVVRRGRGRNWDI